MVILRIKRQLIHSSLTVNEKAYQAGFDYPTNLYKYFKRFNELTPEAFRKKYQ
jgi:AraC-like DNA-binding protein